MPVRSILTRSVISLGVVAGLGAAFVAGTSYAGSDGADPGHSRAVHRGDDATPAAYEGSGLSLPGSCDELLASYVGRGLDLVGPYGWNGYAYPYVINDAAPTPLAAASGEQAYRSPAAPAPVRSTNEE